MESDPGRGSFCFRCGECCATLFQGMAVTYQEHELIHRRTGVFLIHQIRRDNKLILREPQCPFLDEKKSCRIYDFRPCQCRLYHCGRLAPGEKKADTLGEVRMAMDRDPKYRAWKEKTEAQAIVWGNRHGWAWRKSL